jgi:penicillin-binding protein 1A
MKWLTRLIKFGLLMLLLTVAGLATTYFYLAPALPSTADLREVRLQEPLRVFSREGLLVAEFGETRRIPLAYREMPERLVQAFLAAEDDRFFEHPGVDYQGLMRAVAQLLLTGEKRQGGSTITMQVARNLYLSPEKSYVRKLNEILLALRIEERLNKEEILELYLNKIFLGNRAYGVGAAARVYYGKGVEQLTLAEIAMIAGLPKAPSAVNPIADPAGATQRRNYVLGRMRELGHISEAEFQTARDTPDGASLHAAAIEVEAPYLAEMARAELLARFGEQAYTEGHRVFTTLDARQQTAANTGLRRALQEYDQRHGWRGVEGNAGAEVLADPATWDGVVARLGRVGDLRPALVTGVREKAVEIHLGRGEKATIEWEGLKWASPYKTVDALGPAPKKAGDILRPGDLIRVLPLEPAGDAAETPSPSLRLAQVPAAEGALVALDPDNGAIRALVGGYDFYLRKFNRAVQAQRQPGSGFKPFVYSAALDLGFTPATLVDDAPLVIDEPGMESAWRPENYGREFLGPMRLREALTKSRNLVSIRVLRAIGLDAGIRHAQRFGFGRAALPPGLSLALGSGAVSPLEMATAYAPFANGGFRVENWFIERVEGRDGAPLFQADPPRVCPACLPKLDEQARLRSPEGALVAPRILSEQNVYLMNSMLRDVVQYGTATRAKVLKRGDLAGKTGTSNDERDAWFNGYQRSMVAIAWVGFDSNAELGRKEVGGRAALPAWIYFMREALRDVPEAPLVMPPGIQRVRIDPATGLLASPDQEGSIFEVFQAGNLPGQSYRLVGDGGDTLGAQTTERPPTSTADLF